MKNEIPPGDILETAPMIHEAPINLECKVIHIIDTTEISTANHWHDIFIGEVIQAYCEEKYLTNGAPDITKTKFMALASTEKNKLFYWGLGEQIGRAFKIGLKYRKRKKDS